MVKLFNKRMYVYDPHDAIFSLFEHHESVPMLSEGKAKDFRFKSIVLLFILFIVRAGAIELIPKPIDYILMLIAGYLTVEILIRFFRVINKRIRYEGLTGLTKSTLGLFVTIVILALFV